MVQGLQRIDFSHVAIDHRDLMVMGTAGQHNFALGHDQEAFLPNLAGAQFDLY